MACFHPLTAWFNGKGVSVSFHCGPKSERLMLLPCGQCAGCKVDRSRQWAIRCMHEASLHERPSSFVTLTYRDEDMPYAGDLHYRHFQLFMKRLRERMGHPIRFFMCGEYGDNTMRPHYHAILFGCWFGDRTFWRKSSSGFPLYRSSVLESAWNLGNCEIGDVSFESAAYVARYCTKKVTGDDAAARYERLVPSTGELLRITPEFARMSLKPGIGADWLDKYSAEVWPFDRVVLDGKEVPPPRYYMKILERQNPALFESIKAERLLKAFKLADDNTSDRLAVREKCFTAKMSQKKRKLE